MRCSASLPSPDPRARRARDRRGCGCWRQQPYSQWESPSRRKVGHSGLGWRLLDCQGAALILRGYGLLDRVQACQLKRVWEGAWNKAQGPPAAARLCGDLAIEMERWVSRRAFHWRCGLLARPAGSLSVGHGLVEAAGVVRSRVSFGLCRAWGMLLCGPVWGLARAAGLVVAPLQIAVLSPGPVPRLSLRGS